MYKFTSLYLVALFCETAEGSAAEWRAVFEIAELFFALQFSSVQLQRARVRARIERSKRSTRRPAALTEGRGALYDDWDEVRGHHADHCAEQRQRRAVGPLEPQSTSSLSQEGPCFVSKSAVLKIFLKTTSQVRWPVLMHLVCVYKALYKYFDGFFLCW